MGKFQMAPDAIPVEKIPVKTLSNGVKIPAIGLGTFGSDHASGTLVADTVRDALRLGYRYIDCAAAYGNEHEVGAALREALDEGLPREELFVLSKLWNDKHDPEAAVAACKKSIEDLQVGYLDAYLIHWPFPNYHAPGCDGDARNPDSRPYIQEEFMATWHALEKLVDEGLIRALGVSNVTIPKLELILRDARIQPVINEMELHPCFQQGELYQYCVDHGVLPIAFCPLGSPDRPERDKTAEDVADMELPVMKEIAAAHGVHPALICLKWANQRGQLPIPMTTKRKNALSNLKSILEDPLTIEEMEKIKALECNNRLIKGQVFLWPGAKSWLDLWDLDGTIPGWNGYGEA